jgi:magnesium-transporting ATPase (P-type)
MLDPPREEAVLAVAACRDAGIDVKMITGDHLATARAIGERFGLDGTGLAGSALDALDDESFPAAARETSVLARVAPEHKLRLVRELQAQGHVVAMTGDGVNDGPALSQADIGVAMGRHGSDVAREAADLVLLDDNFATIVVAIDQGRSTYANMRRFLTYHLTDNVAELTPLLVWALTATRFPLALGVLQILALDLATDTFSAVALGAEPPSGSADPRPARGHLFNRRVATRALGVLGPAEAVMSMGAFIVSLLAAGWRPGQSFPEGHVLAAASGAAFAAVVIGQKANAFACRSSTRSVLRVGIKGNRMLLATSSVELVLAGLLLAIPALAGLLDHAWPTLAGISVALLAAPVVIAVDALEKGWRRRKGHQLSSTTVESSAA